MDVSQASAKKIQQLKHKYENKSIKIGDSNTKINMSVFNQGDMKITDDVKAFLDRFDHNKDGKLSEEESVVLQKVLVDYAGSDKKLSEKEFAELTGTKVGTPEFKKMWNSLNTIATRQTTGSTQTVETGQHGEKIKSNFNADGSGTKIVETKDKDGKPVKLTQSYGKGGVLEKEVKVDGSGNTTTVNYTNNADGKPVTRDIEVTSKEGKALSKTKTQYQYEEGRLMSESTKSADSKGNKCELTKTYEYKDGVKTTVVAHEVKTNSKNEVTTTEQRSQYQADGKTLSQTDKTITAHDGTVTTVHTSHNDNGKVTESKTVVKDKDNNVTKELTTTNEYGADGKTISKAVTTGTVEGNEYNETVNFDDKGQKVSVDKTHYVRGSKIQEHYEGANLDNRYGFIPSESIEYEADGVTVKQKTINKFDADGVLISQEIQDKDGNVISTHDFSKVDGTFDTSYQKGRGDCYLLAGLNALRASSSGMELLKQNITITQDAQGNNVYTINLPGAKEARQKLIEQGVPEDQIDIKESYTFTEAELHEKAKQAGKKYSAGDKDVLLLEVAYEQYRTDAKNDIQDLIQVKPDMKPAEAEYMLHARGVNGAMGGADDTLSGGQSSDAIFMLTGKPSKELRIRSEAKDDIAVCQIGEDLNMTIVGSSSELSPEMSKNIDNMLDKIAQDCKDGKLDDFAVCAGFNVTSQNVNGQDIKGGGHAFSITKVEGDKVYLQNPWDPTKEIVMTRDEFKQAAKSLSVSPLTQNGQNNVSDIPDVVTPETPPAGGAGNTPGAEPPKTNGTHTVKRGESMWKIAKNRLGSGATATQIANYVQKMIKANPQIKDPNKIYVGQSINMPS